VTAYRVIAPMLSPAALVETIKCTSMRAYYFGVIVVGADPQDTRRLLREGYLEAVETVPAA
jgi:hypothetical protein